MIRLQISTLVFFYALFSVVLMLIVWVLAAYKKAGKVSPKDADYMWKCPVCSNVYVDSRHDDISKCPLCGSYNKK